MALRPSRHAWTYMSKISWAVASSGTFTVLEMAPDRKGCTAAIIFMWPIGAIERVPFLARNAQSNTGRCSSFRCGAPSMVSSRST
jgi:hypothetical protein